MNAEVPIRLINQIAAQDIESVCHAYRRIGITCRPDYHSLTFEGQSYSRQQAMSADLGS